ncbi:efflux RND transporter periplasmic adaptor subunit [Lacihabitans sp. LS3-19]|uniref:efflux RND transporter periplasmic adaptor subunit n=1 Tax=Lacihabitans sp. LS3-19 TaxID=2487335 RepID=UPI0020CE14BC|nr:efflux RND transporter periplasmic adaptor subunit [Lacihabitans sp. LS3-19]
MKNFTKRKSGILLVLALMFVAMGCGKKEDNTLVGKKIQLAELKKNEAEIATKIKTLLSEIEKMEPLKVEKVKTVTVSTVTPSTFQHYVEATGRVEAVNNQFISPQTGGAITNVFVKEGDFVNKGQKIATIDNSILRNSIQEVLIQLETAKTIYERQKNLWDQKIGTEIQLIQAKTSVESLERRITTLKSQDAMNTVVSPISGYVDEVRLKAGEMASPGLGILRIVNYSNLKVTANVPDTYAGTISKGDAVEITFPDLQKSIKAPLSFVSQSVNAVSRTFVVESHIPSFDKQLKPNLTAKLMINDISRGNAIVIPENYIQNTELGKLVYVAVEEGKNKVARAREVKTGLSYNGAVEITSGLQAGDRIITEGYQEVVDGQLINY